MLRRVDSTNRLAWRVRRELAEDDLEIAGAVLLAWEQTAGRGRQGRSWSSLPGLGVYATVCGRLSDPRRLPVMPLAAAVAVVEVLDRCLPVPCRIKWPNDIMVKGRKIAGILVEAAVRPGASPDVLVGFGVNHGHGERELPTPAATSLALETETPPSLPALGWELTEAVVRELRSGESPELVVARWMSRSLHRPGDTVRCRMPETPEGEVVGTFLGLNQDGFLRLGVAGHREVLVTAEVAEP